MGFLKQNKFLAPFSTLVGIFLVLPTLIVVPLSFTDKRTFRFPPTGWSTQWYENFFANSAWYGSALYSLQIALIVTVVATVLGTAAAFGLARSQAPWVAAVRGLMVAPMIVPGVIIALALYIVFLSIGLAATTLGLVLAHSVLAIPIVLVTVAPSVQGLDDALRRAAASLGATPISTFRSITLPLIMPAMLSGALFAFITSFDEAILSLFLVGPFNPTLPITMWSSVSTEADPTIAASSTMLIVFTTTCLVISARLNKRRKNHGITP